MNQSNNNDNSNANNIETIKNNPNLNDNDIKLSLYRTALKLTYLNTCGKLNDNDYSFLFKNTMPIYKTVNYPVISHDSNSNSFMSLNLNPLRTINQLNEDQLRLSSKETLNKILLDYVDNLNSFKVQNSPLYSLNLRCDQHMSVISVYIQYVDNLNDKKDQVFKQEKRFIKLLNLKSMDGLGIMSARVSNETKWSRFIFEQLKNNVINQFKLNKQNLMCLSIDTRLLDKLCFPTFQLYLNDFLHNCILIVPSCLVYEPLCGLIENIEHRSIKLIRSYFESILSLNGKIESFHFGRDTSEFFDLKNLVKTIEVLEFLYGNYSMIVNKLKNQRDINENLVNLFDSIDYYYLTCLLCDVYKFLFDYQINSKRFSSLRGFKLPWHFNGSYLNNLLMEQLKENNQDMIVDDNNKQQVGSFLLFRKIRLIKRNA